MWGWLLSTALAAPNPNCATVSMGDVAQREPGSILVLGERLGVQRDVRRAATIVRKLLRQGPVTVAVDSFPIEAQNMLYRRSAGLGNVSSTLSEIQALPHVTRSMAVYGRLVKLADLGVNIVAAGTAWRTPPDAWTGAAPLAYINVLQQAMGDGPVPVAVEEPLLRRLSWHQAGIAKAAVDAWDKQGTLVIVADRTWVQGGYGIPFQLASLTDAPIDAVLLGDTQAACTDADRTIGTFWDALPF